MSENHAILDKSRFIGFILIILTSYGCDNYKASKKYSLSMARFVEIKRSDNQGANMKNIINEVGHDLMVQIALIIVTVPLVMGLIIPALLK